MKIALSVVTILVLLGGVTYFSSKPIQTKVDMQVDEATQWTPRQIAKDPEGYLFYNEQRAEEAITKLGSALVATSQLTEKMIALQIQAASSRDSLTPVLNRLREAYKAARAEDSWPTVVDGRPFGDAELRKSIVDAHSRLKDQEAQVAFATQQIDDLKARSTRIRSQLSEVKQLKLKVRSDLELVRANGVTDGIEAIQVDISAFQRVGSLIAGTDASDPVSQMLKDQAALASDADFESILSED